MSNSEFKLNLAIVIGINNYQNGISALGTARQDAEAIAHILESDYKYNQVHLLTDNQATAQNLTEFLETKLPDILKTATPSRLLFYFAGHGIALNGDDGPQGYLIPQDAKSGDSSTYIPMQKLESAITNLDCRHCLIILDCCFGGAFRWSSTRKAVYVPEKIYKERYDRFIKDPAWQVITSAGSDQYASDSLILKDDRGKAQNSNNSPFALALINALQGKADIYPVSKNGKPSGDGVITATELYMYLRDEVEPVSEEHNRRQTPLIWSLKKHDKGEFIFLIPGHPLNLENAPPLDESRNPYRGLKSYDEKHSELFFGRTELSQKLDKFVKNHSLTVVLGASGSGKSSLVKAGLIPKLRKDNTEKWSILPPIRPGETPFQALNNALKNAQLPEVELQNPQQNLAMSIDVWAKNNPNSKLLLFIDQSEELITLCQDEDERRSFFQQILKAIKAHQDKLRVVLSLRSDFEPPVRDAGLQSVPKDLKVGNTVLKKRWQRGRFIVPAMTRSDLREVIEKPAEARVMYFQHDNQHDKSPDLVLQLIDEVADMPGALPLLSFALSELYLKYLKRQREAENACETIDRALTKADYQELGGVTLSLTQRADEEYEALVKENSAYEQVIRHLMLRMVAIGGGELARRRVPLSELEYPPEKNSLVKEVIESFTKARLLVKGLDNQSQEYVEPVHDALVRSWARPRDWMTKHLEIFALLERLIPAATDWKNNNRDPDYLWIRDPRLKVFDIDSAEDNSSQMSTNDTATDEPLEQWLNSLEKEFVKRSIDKKREEIQRLEKDLRISEQRRIRAELREKATRSENLISVEPLDSLILAIAAIGQNLEELPEEILAPVQSSLFEAIDVARERESLNLPDYIIAISQNGEIILTNGHNGFDKEMQLWDRQGNRIASIPMPSQQSAAISQDGKTIVSADENGVVQLWDNQGNSIGQSSQLSQQYHPVAISQDGQTIVSGNKGGTVQLWNSQGEKLPEFSATKTPVTSVAISQDAQTIVSGTENGVLQLWSREKNSISEFATGHESSIKVEGNGQFHSITSVAISPDGETIISGGKDGTVRLWDKQGNSIGEPLRGHKDAVKVLAFSSDGETIISGEFSDGSGGLLRFWDRDAKLIGQPLKRVVKNIPKPNEYFGYKDCLMIAISPDGKTVITRNNEGKWLWGRDNPTGKLFSKTMNLSYAFSPDSQTIVTGENSTVQLWDTQGNSLGKPFRKVQDDISVVAFSPDNQTIASGGRDGTIQLCNRQGKSLGEPLKELFPNEAFVKSINFSNDGKTILTMYSFKELWKRPENAIGQPLQKLRDINHIALSPDGRHLVIENSKDGIKQLWNKQSNFTSQPFEQTYDSLSVEDQTILTTHTLVQLWDLQGNVISQLFKGTERPSISSVAISRDGQYIVSGNSDGTVQLWNRQGKPINQALKGHSMSVNSIAFSPDGENIISGSGDQTVRLWDSKGNLIGQPFEGHRDEVEIVAFSPDGQYIISGSNDGEVRFWRGGNWQTWLSVGCERLHNHSLFKNPDNREKREAIETCEKYVWNRPNEFSSNEPNPVAN